MFNKRPEKQDWKHIVDINTGLCYRQTYLSSTNFLTHSIFQPPYCFCPLSRAVDLASNFCSLAVGMPRPSYGAA